MTTIHEALSTEKVRNTDEDISTYTPECAGWAGIDFDHEGTTYRIRYNSWGSRAYALAAAITEGTVQTRETPGSVRTLSPLGEDTPNHLYCYEVAPARPSHREITLTICRDCWTAVSASGSCLC